jgi:hypothetical protein
MSRRSRAELIERSSNTTSTASAMKIGIIGLGNIGRSLTRRLRSLRHDVTVANWREPKSLAALATETGAMAGTVATAAQGADVVVIAVPLSAVADLPAGALRGAVVMDANNSLRGAADPTVDFGCDVDARGGGVVEAEMPEGVLALDQQAVLVGLQDHVHADSVGDEGHGDIVNVAGVPWRVELDLLGELRCVTHRA